MQTISLRLVSDYLALVIEAISECRPKQNSNIISYNYKLKIINVYNKIHEQIRSKLSSLDNNLHVF